MFVQLTLADITAQQTSDSQEFPGLDHTDEDYFLVSGASVSDAAPKAPAIPTTRRVTPPGDDHYDISDGQTLHNIVLWEGFVGVHAGAFLTVIVRNRKNTSWDTLLHAVETVGLAAGAILTGDPTLGQAAVQQLTDGAVALVHDLQGDNDKTLGAFAVRLTTQDGQNLQVTWQTVDSAQLLDQPGDPTVHFHLTGSNAVYELTVSAQVLQPPMIVSVNSGRCLDVPALSVDDVQIQQFAINGGANQRWYLKPLLPAPIVTVQTQPGVNLVAPILFGDLLIGFPSFALINSFSGKALDVRGGVTDDHAAIQQFHAHYGPDQQFVLVNVSGQNGFLIVNVNSGKCFDVVDASANDGALIQQLTINGQANERWTFQQ